MEFTKRQLVKLNFSQILVIKKKKLRVSNKLLLLLLLPAQSGEHSMMFGLSKFSQTKVVCSENPLTAFLTAW